MAKMSPTKSLSAGMKKQTPKPSGALGLITGPSIGQSIPKPKSVKVQKKPRNGPSSKKQKY